MSEVVRKIVVIDPVSKTIKKTYNSKQECCDDLGITDVRRIGPCLKNEGNQCNGTIVKYEDEATEANIKIWIDKFYRRRDEKKL